MKQFHTKSSPLACSLLIVAALLALLLPNTATAQQSTNVSGVVVDSSGSPMVGVAVFVEGTSTGTTTAADGSFQLKVDKGSKLSFNYIGYTSQIFDAASLPKRIVMKEDALSVEEVVVVGYGVQKKETLTGSISQIRSSELTKSPVANMGQALTGRAVGVSTIQASGEPGSDDVTIRIRGIGTLNNASPLVLVDGVERPFSQIDPSEVESMSILKDASSTAVFGIRGANGVIIITTKQGTEGPAKVSFSANFAAQQTIRMPSSLDAATTAMMYNEAKFNDDPTLDPTFSEQDIELYANGSDPLGHPNNDWKNYMMRPLALQQKYNLNISGGTKGVKYYTSLALFDQGGTMKDFSDRVKGLAYPTNYNYNRINIRSNIDVQATKTTSISVQIGGIITNKQTPPSSFASIIKSASLGNPYIYEGQLVKDQNILWGESPLADYFDHISDQKANNINTAVKINQKLDFITKGLSARAFASYDSYYSHSLKKGQKFLYSYLVNGYDENGDPTIMLDPAWELSATPVPSESWDRSQAMHAEAALEYNRTFGGHRLGALILGSLDKKWWRYNSSTAISQYTTVPVSYMGLVGRLTYDYKSRYLFEVNMGYNGSENFAEGKRFAMFPAVSAGWNVTEESWFKEYFGTQTISQLKLRASYGITGNDNTGSRRFMYLSGEYNSGTGAIFGSSTQTTLGGLVEGKQGNPDITWETARKQNYGIDLGMFNNKFNMTVEYFHDDRRDILSSRSTDPGHVSMQGQDVYNIGRVKNHGYEIEASWRAKIAEHFEYHIGGNYSFARNTIIENGSIKDPNNKQLWTTGHPVGTMWGYVTDGFYNTQEEIDADLPKFGNPTIGDVRYLDINNDGTVDSDDRRAMGYPTIPEINYGFSGGFNWKNFSFSFLFQGASHVSRQFTGIFRTPFSQKSSIASFIADERWTPETAQTAKRPKLTLAYTSMSYEDSDLWIRDASYLKLRNVEIGYNIKAEALKRINLGSLRIYLNGQNLYTWDKLKYVDPEANTSDSYKYPQLRIYNIGIQLGF